MSLLITRAPSETALITPKLEKVGSEVIVEETVVNTLLKSFMVITPMSS